MKTREVSGPVACLLSTKDVAPRDRFGFWREAVCDAYVQLSCDTQATERFTGEILLHRLSRISASFVSGSQQHVRRRKRDIARHTQASFLISLQLDGAGRVAQAGRQAHLRPGDFALYSSADVYALDLPDGFRQMVIQIPRDDMLARLPNADMLTGARVGGDTPVGRLVEDAITGLIAAVDVSNEVMLRCIQDTVVDLLATGLASLDGARFELSQPEQQTLLRARAFLQANLSDPDLTRTTLAAAMGLSVRRLGEIFQSEGTSIGATLRAMRLEQTAQDMRDPRFSRFSISQLAVKSGFGNLSHFSRAFRGRFGMTATDYRQTGRPDTAPSALR